MSALAEQGRARNREKVERLTRSSTGRVDASGWKEPLGEHGDVQTGMRPISRRQFRRGGKVEGESKHHMGRKPRSSGGRQPDVRLIDSKGPNRILNDDYVPDRSDAVKQREFKRNSTGISPVKPGKWLGKASGGGLTANSLINRDVKSANESRAGTKHVGGMKHGGSCTCAKCGGGMVGKAGGGAINDGTRPTGGRLARKGGGRAKKGTTVNVIIAPQHGGAARPPMPPPGAMGPPPGPPMPPPGAMPPGGAPPPMGPPPGAGMPPPGLMRKHGGRATEHLAKPGRYPIKDGAGGGKGRLEKARAYG